MPPRRSGRVLSFLSVGEQVRIGNSCDFRLSDAFPPSQDMVPDIDHVQRICDAAREANRILERDTRSVHDAENDARAMIDDWKRTDDDLTAVVSKIEDIKLEHGNGVSQCAEKATAAVEKLRKVLTEDASKRISKRCFDTDSSLARLEYVKNAVGSPEVQQNALCSICIVNPLESYVTPCGHVFCKSCLEKAGEWCYICRGRIHRRMPLYY
nr:RING-finger domain-containing protein [Oceanusvirus sp.]